MSRPNRMLVSENWWRTLGGASIWVLPWDVFDHCPLVLKFGGWNWGPKPLRFTNQ